MKIKNESGKVGAAVAILITIIVVLVAIVGFMSVQAVLTTKRNKEIEEQQRNEMSNSSQNTTNDEKQNKEAHSFTKQEIKEMIGKYVKYTPETGVYSQVKGNSTYAGNDRNTEDFRTENFGWRIWNIDENTLTLIADSVTSEGGTNNVGYLSLENATGYNNSVQIINDICSTCYSNESLAAKRKKYKHRGYRRSFKYRSMETNKL